MAEILPQPPVGNNVLIFETLQNTKIYCAYQPENTTLQKIIDTFFNKYACKEFSNENINLYANELKTHISEIDTKKTMHDLKFTQFSKIILQRRAIAHDIQAINKAEEAAIIKNIFQKTEGKSFKHLLCKTLTGKIIDFDAPLDMTVGEVKYLIQ